MDWAPALGAYKQNNHCLFSPSFFSEDYSFDSEDEEDEEEDPAFDWLID